MEVGHKVARVASAMVLGWVALCLPAAAQGPSSVFQPTEMLTLHLQLDPADWVTIQNDDSYSIEVPAQFWAEGETPILVGVRRKSSLPLTGTSAFNKVSVRIDMNEYVVGQEWRDLKMLSIENGDDSNVFSEGLSWMIYQLASGTHGMGYPGARFGWVKLMINGVDTGVYVNPEVRDKRFLENRNLWIPGLTWLYEIDEVPGYAESSLGAPPNSPTFDALCYEPFLSIEPTCGNNGLDAGEECDDGNNDDGDGCSSRCMNEPPVCDPSMIETHAPQLVNMQGLLTVMAAGAFTADRDNLLSHQKNFYFADFSDGTLRRYYPWDMDSALPGRTNYGIYVPRRHSPFVDLLDIPSFREQYSRIFNDLICGPWSEASLHGYLDSLSPTLTAALAADPNPAGGPGSFYSYLTERVNYVLSEIENFVPCTSVQLELNEVMASNSTFLEDPDEPGEYPDWFEIRNPGSTDLEVGGVFVSDDPLDPMKYEIPSGVVIPAQGYMLFYADDDGTQGPQHTNFKLSASGGTLELYDRNGVSVLDSITWGPLATDVAIGRFPNGSGPWDLLPVPTPGAANGPHNAPPVLANTVRSVQWPNATDVVSVTTWASDNVGLAEVRLHHDAGTGEVAAPMTDQGDGSFVGTLPAFATDTIVRYWISATDNQGASTIDPLPAPSLTYTYKVGHEPPPLVINEYMASNQSAVPDPEEPGAHEDWFEIYNAGSAPVALDGMYVTDNLFAPKKHPFPAGLVVPAHGHLVFWADNEPFQGPHHLPFRLSAEGEELGLFDRDVNGNVQIDALQFGLQTTNVSEGRCPDGDAVVEVMTHATAGFSNVTLSGCSNDPDADGWGNATDNCPDVANASQDDIDGDSIGDYCDTNDGLIWIRFQDSSRVEWEADLMYTSWNVYSGGLANLRATGVYTEASPQCGLTDPFLDQPNPLPGTVQFYLVTGNNGGGESSLGTNSAGEERPNSDACP